MPKYCFNYETGAYEWITEEGYSLTSGRYVLNWDNSAYEEERRQEEEERLRQEELLWNTDRDFDGVPDLFDNDDSDFDGIPDLFDNDDDLW